MNWLELIDELQAQNPEALKEQVVVKLADGFEISLALTQDMDRAKDRLVLCEVP